MSTAPRRQGYSRGDRFGKDWQQKIVSRKIVATLTCSGSFRRYTQDSNPFYYPHEKYFCGDPTPGSSLYIVLDPWIPLGESEIEITFQSMQGLN
jgi:hypothetical protein